MSDVKDKKSRLVKDKKFAKQSEFTPKLNWSEKDKQAVEFLKKHPIPKNFLP